MDALLVATALSCTQGKLRMVLLSYALFSAGAYTISTFIGGLIPLKPLITFELMVWISSPIFLINCFLNGWRYFKFNSSMDLVLLGVWGWLLVTMLAYWLYNKLEITQKLWAKRIWFSQNDVLHIGLILWVLYITAVVTNQVFDYPVTI